MRAGRRLSGPSRFALATTLVLALAGLATLFDAPPPPPAPVATETVAVVAPAALAAPALAAADRWALRLAAGEDGWSAVDWPYGGPTAAARPLAAVLAQLQARDEDRPYLLMLDPWPPQVPPLAAAGGALLASLDAAGIPGDRVWLASADWRLLAALAALREGLTLGFVSSEQPGFDTVQRRAASPWLNGGDLAAAEGSLPRLVAGQGGQLWLPDYRDLRPVELNEAEALGLRVVVWQVADPALSDALRQLGVDGVVTAVAQ